MPKNFHNISMHVSDEGAQDMLSSKPQTAGVRGAAAAKETPTFNNDESAARYYLSRAFDRDRRPVVRGLTAPTRPEVVPDLKLLEVRSSGAPPKPGDRRSLRSAAATMGAGGAKLVRFEQTRANIPVFGARAIVELDAKRQLISIDATVANIGDVSHVAALSVQSALDRVAAAAHVPVESLKDVEAPNLTFFNDPEDRWHLAYVFRNVAVVPPIARTSRDPSSPTPVHGGHGLGRSPRELRPLVNYLIDAHDGEVLLSYSASPMVVLCRGLDDEGQTQRFYGSRNGTAYEMYDSLRSVRTFDLDGGDIDGKFPKAAIRSKVSDPWVGAAAVSAHVNAMRVQQFFAEVLGRHGVDDKGMELVSVVNCTYAADQAPPEWHNAVWYGNRMWYGRMKDKGGAMKSYARHLDIIGHEIMHGVTEKSAGLVYLNQSGALDESISDIFGVIINNWFRVGVDSDVGNWNWEIGTGLGDGGKPLRDMGNPACTGDPSHMKAYDPTTDDNGGVHTNSNIHNLAAYSLLNAKDGAKRAMLPSDVAVLYYLALQRLGQLSGFSDMRRALVAVAKTYFGKPAERKRMLAHIEDAYDAVGID